jgi:hypothetical protein
MLHVATLKVFACTSELPMFLYSCAFKWDPCSEKNVKILLPTKGTFLYALGEPAATLVPWSKSQNPFKSFLNVTNIHYIG